MAPRARASSTAIALWIVAVLVVLFFLRTARELLIPIALAVLISYALEPVVAWLARHRVHRMVGTLLVLASIVGAVGFGGYALRGDAIKLAQALPRAVEQAREQLLSRLGSAGEGVLGGPTGGGSSESKPTEFPVGTSGEADGSFLQRVVSAVFAFAGHAVVVFFLILFLLASGPHVRNRIIEVAGRGNKEMRQTTAVILDEINAHVQRYLLVLLFTACVVAVATWLALAWMGVQHAMMWGVLAGAFNSIPYFGPVVVSGGLFVVGLVQGGSAQAFQMAGAAVLITSLEGWLLTPVLMGKAERMSALAVFLGLLLWTWMWGAWGTILAVPMLVIIKSVADHVDRLKPVGRLMAR